MIVSFGVQNQYSPFGNAGYPFGNGGGLFAQKTGMQRQNSGASMPFTNFADKIKADEEKRTEDMRKMVRTMQRQNMHSNNPFAPGAKDVTNTLWGMYDTDGKDDEELYPKVTVYNYKEVSSKIQSAKNSVSAGAAVLAAKRKVQEVKKKIANGDGDPEELQMALTHARSMELVARKKKHHLEIEEMVQVTQKRDENAEKQEKIAQDMRSALVEAEEEKISEKERDIFKERKAMLKEALKEMREREEEITKEKEIELNKKISEFGEDELKRFEEEMEILENMEIIDPHMSKEAFEDLKRKHRASENKAIVKADMDYLKDLLSHQAEQKTRMTNMTPSASSAVSSAAFSASVAAVAISAEIPTAMVSMPSVSASVPEAASAEGASIDVAV